MNGTVSVSCLGFLGRFGNQLWQYSAARGYAESIGARLETPPWIGQKLFENINDPAISRILPTPGFDTLPKNGETNIDLTGYFQFNECFKSYTLSKLRLWFQIKPAYLELFGPPTKELVVHFRRGDYTAAYKHIFCTIARESYEEALMQYGYDLMSYVEVDEDKPNHFGDRDLDFLTDFMRLYNADVLFRANSTFSWWAGTLGHASKIYSPVVEGHRGVDNGVKFVPGNHPRCVDLPNVHDYIIAP